MYSVSLTWDNNSKQVTEIAGGWLSSFMHVSRFNFSITETDDHVKVVSPQSWESSCPLGSHNFNSFKGVGGYCGVDPGSAVGDINLHQCV